MRARAVLTREVSMIGLWKWTRDEEAEAMCEWKERRREVREARRRFRRFNELVSLFRLQRTASRFWAQFSQFASGSLRLLHAAEAARLSNFHRAPPCVALFATRDAVSRTLFNLPPPHTAKVAAQKNCFFTTTHPHLEARKKRGFFFFVQDLFDALRHDVKSRLLVAICPW